MGPMGTLVIDADGSNSAKSQWPRINGRSAVGHCHADHTDCAKWRCQGVKFRIVIQIGFNSKVSWTAIRPHIVIHTRAMHLVISEQLDGTSTITTRFTEHDEHLRTIRR